MNGDTQPDPGSYAGSDNTRQPGTGIDSMAFERQLVSRLLDTLGISELAFVLWDGRTVSLPTATPIGSLVPAQIRPALDFICMTHLPEPD